MRSRLHGILNKSEQVVSELFGILEYNSTRGRDKIRIKVACKASAMNFGSLIILSPTPIWVTDLIIHFKLGDIFPKMLRLIMIISDSCCLTAC
jgi:hypothetical protein